MITLSKISSKRKGCEKVFFYLKDNVLNYIKINRFLFKTGNNSQQ